MASTQEIQGRIQAKEQEIVQLAHSLSQAAKRKREAEAELTALKDELLDALLSEVTPKNKTR